MNYKNEYTQRIETLMDRIHEWGEEQPLFDCGEEAIVCALINYILKMQIPKQSSPTNQGKDIKCKCKHTHLILREDGVHLCENCGYEFKVTYK